MAAPTALPITLTAMIFAAKISVLCTPMIGKMVKPIARTETINPQNEATRTQVGADLLICFAPKSGIANMIM